MLAAIAAQRSSPNCLNAPIAQLACLRAVCWRRSAERVSISMSVFFEVVLSRKGCLRAAVCQPIGFGEAVGQPGRTGTLPAPAFANLVPVTIQAGSRGRRTKEVRGASA